MSDNGCLLFHTEELNSIPLLHPHFQVICHYVRVPLCCYLSRSNSTVYWQEGSNSTAIPPISTSDIMNQCHQIQASLLEQPFYFINLQKLVCISDEVLSEVLSPRTLSLTELSCLIYSLSKKNPQHHVFTLF